MMGCQEVCALSQRFVDLELSPADEAEVRRHLAVCASCRAEVEAREPLLALVRGLAEAAASPAEDESFVSEVIAGVHQRALERRLLRRSPGRWAVAAALAIALLGGGVLLRHRTGPGPMAVAVRTPVSGQPAEPAFIEVQGDGVRVYQLASPGPGTTQVAFIVDPHMEL